MPRRILVATDFSPPSDDALTTAVDFARQMGAIIEIVHVEELFAGGIPLGLAYDNDQGARAARVDEELARRAQRVTKAGVRADIKVLEGDPVVQIIGHAREIGADLIVLGTHGRRGLSYALLGSVAQRVLQRSRCPVLTVPLAKKAA
jgi:nucleotide-binding universal stress UspA family protein